MKGASGESGASTDIGSGRRPVFKGTCLTCGQRGHRRQDCRVKRLARVNTFDATPFGGNVAFPATMSTLIADSDGFVAATAKVPPSLPAKRCGAWIVARRQQC
jgi:hypothetical protein